jgi:hypothetical protein
MSTPYAHAYSSPMKEEWESDSASSNKCALGFSFPFAIQITFYLHRTLDLLLPSFPSPPSPDPHPPKSNPASLDGTIFALAGLLTLVGIFCLCFFFLMSASEPASARYNKRRESIKPAIRRELEHESNRKTRGRVR